MKNNWFQKNKKIKLSEQQFHIFVLLVSLYSIIATIVFAFAYFNNDTWKEVVKHTGETFPEKIRLKGDALQNLAKVIYLVRFWGSLLTVLLILVFSFIYSRKVKFGYLFPISWIFVFAGLIIVNVTLVTENTVLLVFKVLSIIPILVYLLYILIDLYNYRKRLNNEYYIRIKKGEF